MTDIDKAREVYELLDADWEAFPFWSIERTAETLDAADRLISALTARCEQAEAALARDEWYRQNKPEAMEDYRTEIDRLRAEVARLKATMHKVIPFIGWGAYVPDLVQEAEDVSGYGGRDE
jgi:hypothetical protein